MAQDKPKFVQARDLLLDQIGRRVIARRQQLGLTQGALAARLGIKGTSVGRIENGQQNVTVEMLCRVAEALETTVHELLLGAHAQR